MLAGGGVDKKNQSTDIAIIGIACRFPGANNREAFWLNISQGVDSISEITPDRWDVSKFYSPERDAKNKSISKWGGLLDRIDTFDASFFNISAREAQIMDPQQRLLLQEAWHCIEDSGIVLKELQEKITSVYIGVMANDYHLNLTTPGQEINGYHCLGNYVGILANRLSYYFNFTGESEIIDAACASSLVAIHNGRRDLLAGQCAYALVGGVNVICHPWKYISFSHAHMLSPDGHCKTFDASANGYVPGEGVGLVLLETLENAIKNGHHIYGLVKGSAVHHSGRTKTITAPKIEAQKDVIQNALRNAHLSSEHITYVEAHGTGTSLGDPIEIAALTDAFDTDKKNYCKIASVKTNVGHLEAAAGIAGTIKVLMMFKHRQIPPSLNVSVINPIINFEQSPFSLSTHLEEWVLPMGVTTRYAGVSSFGFGGMDSHVIFQEYQPKKAKRQRKRSDKTFPITFSAKSPENLQQLLSNWLEYIYTDDFSRQSLQDICLTQLYGREHFTCRYANVVASKSDLINVIKRVNKTFSKNVIPEAKPLILNLLPQRGLSFAQLSLYSKSWPVLAQLLKEYSKLIKKAGGDALLKTMKSAKARGAAQLEMFVVLCILGKAFLKSGFKPHYITGRGVGELAAAHLAGIINFTALVQCLIGKISFEEIELSRPFIRFYSTHYQRTIDPFNFSIEYCSILHENFDISPKLQYHYFKEAYELEKNQYSFKHYLNEADAILAKFNIILTDVVRSQDLSSLNSRQKNLCTAILLLCLKKLNTKWNLPDEYDTGNEVVKEVIDLLLDRVVSYESAARLALHEDEQSWRVIANEMFANRALLDNKKPYALLRGLNLLLSEIPNKKSWLQELLANPTDTDLGLALSYDDIEDTLYVDVGSTQHFTHSLALDLNNFQTALPSFLATLWQSKIPVDWTCWYENKDYLHVPLPTYCFTPERHWYAQTTTISEPVSPKVVSSATQPVSNVTLISSAKNDINLSEKTLTYLKGVFSKVTGLTNEQLLPNLSYEQFGINSLKAMEIIQVMQLDLGKLPPTLLFEKNRLSKLAKYLILEHEEGLRRLFAQDIPEQSIPPPANVGATVPDSPIRVNQKKINAEPSEDIAIIGISGQYPKAKNLQELWKNLKTGRDCIDKIPDTRWRAEDFPVTTAHGEKIYDQGGFLSDVDKFDPLFFNITPQEASISMDPQERLFLQTAWSVIEDAGYTRKRLEETVSNNVGVFVGVTYNYFPLYHAEEWSKNNRLPLDIQSYSIANRVSYFFDFHGPSFPIDTACSSSLSAIHLACESIIRGECQMALAGGVNLSLHPAKYHYLGVKGFMSDEGRCLSFAANGTGYVPSEAVGAVLLKPLAKAIADGDHIYGVIRSSSINHGGRTSGFTVPNPEAQAALIANTFVKADINPRSIQYVEAHGTGTSLGDPIEVRGLQLAFEQMTKDKQFCALGSIKSNIGHAESAAGISQITKVVLQLHHKELVPTIHAEQINPYLDLPNTPFYLQQTSAPWPENSKQPRRAAISSFGSGGANAHLIIDEYVNQSRATEKSRPCVLVVSAANQAVLKEYIENIYQFVLQLPNLDAQLEDFCYTFQVGREEMSERCVFVVADYEDLLQQLADYLHTDKQPSYDHPIANQWLAGAAISWQQLYSSLPKVLPFLPTYPFVKRRCWLPGQNYFQEQASPAQKVIDLPKGGEAWLYQDRWQEIQLNHHPQLELDKGWLFFCTSTNALTDNGMLSEGNVVQEGDQFGMLTKNAYEINPNSKADYAELFKSVSTEHEVTNIVYFAPADNADIDTVLAEPEHILKPCKQFLLFLQCIEAYSWQQKPRIWLITQTSQKVLADDQIDVASHPLWSLVGIYNLEEPDYEIKRIDLNKKLSIAKQINQLKSLWSTNTNEELLALRNDKIYTLTIQALPTQQRQSANFKVPKFALITGGLGALGGELESWLVQMGTKRLLVVGNASLPDRDTWSKITDPRFKEKIAIMNRLESQGAQVAYFSVDVANEKALRTIIQEQEKSWETSIDSVFHLAGVTTDDIPVKDLKPDVLEGVCSPKAKGAIALHNIFLNKPLLNFVLYSSVSASPYSSIKGIGAYAVANSFLNALAYYRQELQLPALALGWTAWGEKGMSHQFKQDAYLNQLGIESLPIELGMKLLGYLLTQNYTHVIVEKVNWLRFLQLSPRLKNLLYFASVAHTKPTLVHVKKRDLSQIKKIVATTFGELVGLKTTEIDQDKPFQAYGLDSVEAVKLVVNLSDKFPNILTVNDLFRYVTIDQLANYIFSKSQDAKNSEKPNNQDEVIDTMDELDGLTEDEIAQLLRKELGKG